MDRKTAVAKIRKCLNLARSAEAHEAAAALRQAQKLMAGFEIAEHELADAGVDEAWVKSSASARPARFEVRLASMVAGAFGCEIVFTRRLNESGTKIIGGYAFIGVAPAEQVASTHSRCSPANYARRARTMSPQRSGDVCRVTGQRALTCSARGGSPPLVDLFNRPG